MTETRLNLTETTVDGPRTQRWELNVTDCLELAARRVSRLGIHQAMAPYRRVRVRPSGSFVLACFDGEGRVLLESSNDKLEVVEAQVGYESAIVFSRAFKRWIGRSPSEYRRGS